MMQTTPIKAPILPRALRPGDAIGIIAPASPMQDAADLRRAVAALEALGYPVKLGKSATARWGDYAGEDALRAADVNAMFADESVRAILCLRGGYGSGRLLSLLDYDLIRANPKIFCGYSDITAMHSAIRAHTGLVTFHSPVCADFAKKPPVPYTVQCFLRAISCAEPLGRLCNPNGAPLETLVAGVAEGTLAGGNLAIVTAGLGTPYACEFDGAILFLEDIDECPRSIDRMLTQLTHAGAFARAAGVVLGAFTHCGEEAAVQAVLHDRLGGLSIPVAAGLSCGHIPKKVTLPLGVRCRLDAGAGVLEVTEAGVR
ncbi:MAG: LD-carboxypeptidase [Oscillospiraceae bacterium]|jgi:muramoyltetrapeptide carboxypeptidase|nr:LD-carboxypeptidase [Oscillospiraceae bacterium]